MSSILRSTLLLPLASGALALALGLSLLAVGLSLSGYDAALALGALWRGAFGSWFAIGSATLVRAIPLIVIGLGFALALRAGALNIGAEGQFLVGAVAATWTALVLGDGHGATAIVVVLTTSIAAGVLWVALPTVLRVRFGVFEAISTLLLNFVALSLVSYLVQGPLQEPTGVYPQSEQLPRGLRLWVIPGSRLHAGFALAVLLAVVLWWLLRRTHWGFMLRAVGVAPKVASITGRIDDTRLLGGALLISGAFAGLAGGLEVTGVTFALYQNLSPGYGFTAIAVALLARLHPLAIVATGVLFGALEAGAGAMQRDAGVPSVAVFFIEAVVIITVLLSDKVVRSVRLSGVRSAGAP